MIDQPFRHWLADRAAPITKCYQLLGLSPNSVTLLGCGFEGIAALATALGHGWAALALWWMGRIFDGTDGIYARMIGKVSDFGGYLDIVADMAAYSVMILGFAYARPDFMPWWLIILMLYILCISSALALGALERREGLGAGDNRSLRLAAGLAEGGETGITYSILLIFPNTTVWLCPLWAVVLAATVTARTLIARRELRL